MSIQELVKTYLVVSESIKQSESNKKTSGQNKTSSTPVFTNNTDIANLIPTNLKSSLTQTNGIVNSSNISIFNNTLNKTNAFDNIINSSAQISNATQTNQNDLAGALTDIMKNFSNMIASLFGSNVEQSSQDSNLTNDNNREQTSAIPQNEEINKELKNMLNKLPAASKAEKILTGKTSDNNSINYNQFSNSDNELNDYKTQLPQLINAKKEVTNELSQINNNIELLKKELEKSDNSMIKNNINTYIKELEAYAKFDQLELVKLDNSIKKLQVDKILEEQKNQDTSKSKDEIINKLSQINNNIELLKKELEKADNSMSKNYINENIKELEIYAKLNQLEFIKLDNSIKESQVNTVLAE